MPLVEPAQYKHSQQDEATIGPQQLPVHETA